MGQLKYLGKRSATFFSARAEADISVVYHEYEGGLSIGALSCGGEVLVVGPGAKALFDSLFATQEMEYLIMRARVRSAFKL